MFLEDVVFQINDGLRPVTLWTKNMNRTAHLLELSKSKENIKKVKDLAWEHIRTKYRVAIEDTEALPRVRPILSSLADSIYQHIVDYNIEKFTKGDQFIVEYIRRISGRCFIHVLEEHNKKCFAEGTKAYERVAHYVDLVVADTRSHKEFEECVGIKNSNNAVQSLSQPERSSVSQSALFALDQSQALVLSNYQKKLIGHFLLAGVICPKFITDRHY